MKNLLATTILALGLCATNVAMAESFNKVESQTRVQYNDVGVTVQTALGNNERQIGIDYTIFDFLTLGARRVENETPGQNENVGFISAKFSAFDLLYFAPVVEARYIDGIGDDHVRLIPTVGIEHSYGELPLRVYGQVSPEFTYEMDTKNNFSSPLETEFEIGFMYSFTNELAVGAYLQTELDKDWDHKDTFAGVRVGVSF